MPLTQQLNVSSPLDSPLADSLYAGFGDNFGVPEAISARRLRGGLPLQPTEFLKTPYELRPPAAPIPICYK